MIQHVKRFWFIIATFIAFILLYHGVEGMIDQYINIAWYWYIIAGFTFALVFQRNLLTLLY